MLWIIISLLWCTFAIGVLLFLKSRYRALKPLQDTNPAEVKLPSLAVVVPARNEAENIGPCLEKLIRQIYPHDAMQIIVVDDGSTDETGRIARQFEGGSVPVRVLEGGSLPEGWLGKPHACWVGANAAQSDWLCFLDADTRHAPNLLAAAVAHAVEEKVDLLSLHPNQEMLGFWERLLMPVPFMTLMILLDSKRINDPSSGKAMANGQCILIRREVYEAVGGHRAIRAQVLEDVALARLVKSSGHRLKLLGGGDLIYTRMYTDLRSLWQGLARGGSELFGVPLTSLAVINSFIVAILPLALPAWLMMTVIRTPGTTEWLAAALACLGSIAWYAAHSLTLRTHRVPYRYLLLLPLSNVFVAFANVDGLLRRSRGIRLWKGRKF